jgi:hypothetical protein
MFICTNLELRKIRYYIEIDKNEMGGACGVYGEGQRCAQGVSGEARGKEAIGETKT